MCDVMVDLETLGKKQNAVILSISAVQFDPYSDYIGKTFSQCIDIDSCLNHNMSIDGECFHFWLDQNIAARRSLTNTSFKSLKESLQLFTGFLKQINTLESIMLWGNGIIFDNSILKNAYHNSGLEYPIGFRNDRDVRTIAGLISKKEFTDIQNKIRSQTNLTQHNSLDDAKFQAMYIQKIYKRLNLRNYK